jgi:hypothetical protein
MAFDFLHRKLIKILFQSILVLLIFGCADLSAQDKILDKKYSFSYDSIRLSAFLDSLTTQYEISFSYDASLVSGDLKVYAEADSVYLDEWLLNVLDNAELKVKELRNHIIISGEPARMPIEAVSIDGVVKNSLESEPMPMVNIGVEGKTIGTSTNKNGRFRLYLPPEFIGDQLVFSNLGYAPKQITIPPQDTTVFINLTETSVQLPEVLVRYVEPERIIQEVVRQKKNNYAMDPLILTAFFRETIQQDEQYVDVSEAVIEIFKPPYTRQFAQERVRFVKGRKGEFSADMEMINFKLQGGPLLFSRVDIIRVGGFLPDENGRSKYRYSFEGMDYEHGRNVFVVGFKPRSDNGELLYEGEMRVDEKTFALVGANFEMTRKAMQNSREYLIRRDSRRFRTRPFFARYTIDYRPYEDIWVLNKVRGEVSMRIKDREKRVRTVFNTVSEMYITNHREAERKTFSWNETFKANYILSDEINSYDPDFWSRFNVISPDESIEKIFRGNDAKVEP